MTQAILTAAQWLNFDGLVDLIRDYRRKQAQKALERRTYKELSALTDRELHDLGIGRSDIRSISKGNFDRGWV